MSVGSLNANSPYPYMVLDTSILLVPCKDKEPIPTQYRPTFSRSILGACAFEHKRGVAILPTTNARNVNVLKK